MKRCKREKEQSMWCFHIFKSVFYQNRKLSKRRKGYKFLERATWKKGGRWKFVSSSCIQRQQHKVLTIYS